MIPLRKAKIIFFITFALFFYCNADAGEISRGALWKVSEGNNSVYLLGSVHMLKSDGVFFNHQIEQVFNDSQVLVFEVDLKDMATPASQQIILAKGMLPANVSLEKKINKKTYGLARAKTAELGLDIASFSRYKPWFFIMTLTMFKLQMLGFSHENGLDTFYYTKATQSGKKILALETFKEQMEMLDSMSKVNQNHLVCRAIKDLDVLEEDINTIIKAWAAGDINKLNTLILKSFNEFPDIYNVLITQRNKKWFKKIESFLKQKENYMIVVGVAHLAGKEGLVELLKKKGYSVNQL